LGKKYPSVSKPIIDDNTASSNGSDYARDVYINGILPFYQSHGSKIDSFFFSHYCDGLGAFRKFDISGIKLKQLKLQCVARNNPLFIEELVHSQQSKYIQKLVLKYVVPEPLAMVSHLEALTHLVISFQVKNYTIRGSIKPTIEFSQLINACPAALAHLTTKRVNFTFSESTLNTTSIQYMKLVDVDFTANTTITWTSFPELSHLYLKSIVSGCLTITLPRNHLKEASIDNKYQRDETCGFSAKAMNEDELKRSVIWSDGERGIGGRLCGPNKFDPGLEPDNMVYFTYASVEVLDYTITEMYYSDDDNE
jgi:hypothetical protein